MTIYEFNDSIQKIVKNTYKLIVYLKVYESLEKLIFVKLRLYV